MNAAVAAVVGMAFGLGVLAIVVGSVPAPEPRRRGSGGRRPGARRHGRRGGALVLLLTRWPVAGLAGALAGAFAPQPAELRRRRSPEALTEALALWTEMLPRRGRHEQRPRIRPRRHRACRARAHPSRRAAAGGVAPTRRPPGDRRAQPRPGARPVRHRRGPPDRRPRGHRAAPVGQAGPGASRCRAVVGGGGRSQRGAVRAARRGRPPEAPLDDAPAGRHRDHVPPRARGGVAPGTSSRTPPAEVRSCSP